MGPKRLKVPIGFGDINPWKFFAVKYCDGPDRDGRLRDRQNILS